MSGVDGDDTMVLVDGMTGYSAYLFATLRVTRLVTRNYASSPHSPPTIAGMFAYSGLTPEQVQRLRERHVYMNMDGRMSISGINSGNVEYLAKSMHEATK